MHNFTNLISSDVSPDVHEADGIVGFLSDLNIALKKWKHQQTASLFWFDRFGLN